MSEGALDQIDRRWATPRQGLRGIRAALLVAAAAALLGSGCGSAAKTTSATTTAAPGLTLPRVPARDRFSGALHGGMGSLAGARDSVEARLQAPGTTGTRRLTLWIVSTGCPASATCAHLAGSLRGQLRPVRALPDVGRRYAIEASGSLGRVGVMTAAGTVAGTGNINSGFESLELKLTGRGGSARLNAHSGRVPPFTSP
ncbi:MAG TPA: hypothetical protein VJ741_06990 [Solirubrobacteraceae bacterium]|nr:hypothetical protein [Solirubrobacteraceae bacterium]